MENFKDDLMISIGVRLIGHQPELINVVAERPLVGFADEYGNFIELNGYTRPGMEDFSLGDGYDLEDDYVQQSYIFPISLGTMYQYYDFIEEDAEIGSEAFKGLIAEYYEDVIKNTYYIKPREGAEDKIVTWMGDKDLSFAMHEIDFTKDYYLAYNDLTIASKNNMSSLVIEEKPAKDQRKKTEGKNEAVTALRVYEEPMQVISEEKRVDADSLEKQLKKRIVAQDEACESLVDIYDKNSRYSDYEGMKSNVLIIGPSGVGKTEMTNTLAKLTDKTIINFDVTKSTASGYVGDNVINCLKLLYLASDKDLEKTEEGIIVLDEIDKIASSTDGETIAKKDVQNELLKLLDGGKFEVPISNGLKDDSIIIDTTKITFIASGAFSDLFKDREKNVIGFTSDDKKLKNKPNVETEELIKYGLTPEFLRRFSYRIVMKDLSKADLKQILLESDISALNMYNVSLLNENNVKLVYSSETVNAIIEYASEHKGGASGLKGAVDHTMSKAIRQVGRLKDKKERELVITEKTVEDPKNFKINNKSQGTKTETEKARTKEKIDDQKR